ncbi:MAG: spermidine synthase, partial [Myxococcota bacterium]
VLPGEDVDPFWRWPTFYARLLMQISWVVGPAALFAGAAFPLGNAIVQRGRDHVGARAGVLYLANTVGGVLGSIVAGFVLLPRLGIQATVTVVMVCVLAALVAVWRATAWRSLAPSARRLQATASALLVLALSAWSLLPEQFLLRRSLPLAADSSQEGVIAINEGVNETLAVLYLEGPTIRLLTNGFSMSDTGFESQRYMRSFAHVPLLIGGDIQKVMVMCYGVGNTADAVLMHPGVQHVDVVDFSYDVLLHSENFAASNGHPLEDPRVDVYVNDARHHLHMLDGETYDLVTGEPPPMPHAGVVNLYSRDFFELVRSRLRPDGLVTYWLPLWQVGEAAALSIVRGFLDAFPGAVLLSGYRDELILVGRKGEAPIEIDPELVAARIAAVPGLRDELRGIALDSPAEQVGLLAATTPTLERATRGVAPLVDDHPTLEYAIRAVQRSPRIPRDLASVDDVERWCPRCATGALTADDQRHVRGYLDVIARFYRSEAFLAGKSESPLDPDVPLSHEEGLALGDSLYLQDLVYAFPPEYKRALQLARHGRPDLAVRSLEEVLRANPEHPRARRDLEWLRERTAAAQH